MTAPAPHILHRGRFLSLIKEGHWEYATRSKTQGREEAIEAVGLIAVTPEQELILVEQYRIPVHANTIELPAGLAFDHDAGDDETLAGCAQRELLEETGYHAGQVKLAAKMISSGGLTDESINLFLTTDLVRKHKGGGVDGEDITVHHVPVDGLMDWLTQQNTAGKQIDSRVYAALAFI